MCDRSREGAQRRGHARDRWTAIARSVFVLDAPQRRRARTLDCSGVQCERV